MAEILDLSDDVVLVRRDLVWLQLSHPGLSPLLLKVSWWENLIPVVPDKEYNPLPNASSPRRDLPIFLDQQLHLTVQIKDQDITQNTIQLGTELGE